MYDVYRSLYAKSLRFLGLRLRSEQEVRDKLRVWLGEISQYGESKHERDEAEALTQGTDDELIERVVTQLKKEHFLDDERFAREWIVSRLKRGKRGPAVIRMELKQKGIDESVMTKMLAEVEQEEVGVSESEGAMKAAEKYIRKLEGRDEREQKMKLYAYLRGKGFSSSVVAEIVKELFLPRL